MLLGTLNRSKYIQLSSDMSEKKFCILGQRKVFWSFSGALIFTGIVFYLRAKASKGCEKTFPNSIFIYLCSSVNFFCILGQRKLSGAFPGALIFIDAIFNLRAKASKGCEKTFPNSIFIYLYPLGTFLRMDIYWGNF